MQNLSNTEYHAHPAIGASGLKLLNQAPAKYYAAYLDPNRKPLEPTPAMLKGTMIHTACLEPHLFDEQYITLPDGIDRRTKEGKELYDSIEASGKQAIKPDDAALSKTLADAFNFHPFIIATRHINSTVNIEKSFITDINGVQVKIRPDVFVEPCKTYPNGLIIDLKTTADASRAGWSKSIVNYEYYLQSALYSNVLRDLYMTDELAPFYWFAQETDAPYLNKPYRATDMIQQYGWDECLRLLEVYKECQQSGAWFGYGEDTEDAELPIWKQREITASEGEIEVSYVK